MRVDVTAEQQVPVAGLAPIDNASHSNEILEVVQCSAACLKRHVFARRVPSVFGSCVCVPGMYYHTMYFQVFYTPVFILRVKLVAPAGVGSLAYSSTYFRSLAA